MSGPMERAAEEARDRLQDAWAELRGYVAEAQRDRKPLVAAEILSYMDELKRWTQQPLDEALASFPRQTGPER